MYFVCTTFLPLEDFKEVFVVVDEIELRILSVEIESTEAKFSN